MRNDHQKVLVIILNKTNGYTGEVITEAFEVMTQFAPTLAAVPALAGHWVRTVLAQTFIAVGDIEQLCNAELAAREVKEHDGLDENMMFRAYLAGLSQGAYNRNVNDGDFDAREAFERWMTE